MVTSPSASFRDFILSPKCFCRFSLSVSNLADISNQPWQLTSNGIGATNLVLQLNDPVDQCLSGRRATWNVDIDGNDAITAAHHGIGIVVVAAAVGTRSH